MSIETRATTNLARRHGRARRGQRLVAAVPHGHWKTSTFVAALRHDRITAPCVFDGAINGARFRAYVEQALAPTLRPGDLVIMDNLGAHKVAGVREAIQARGARLLYLPPYPQGTRALSCTEQSALLSRKCGGSPEKIPEVAAAADVVLLDSRIEPARVLVRIHGL